MKREWYDEIDMRNNYNRGFWLGSLAGVLGMFIMCLFIGVFISY